MAQARAAHQELHGRPADGDPMTDRGFRMHSSGSGHAEDATRNLRRQSFRDDHLDRRESPCGRTPELSA